ncbi:hypothetical protein VdG2_08734 [Verticillium dahliae VDG2]|nr:hypothetical protein VdG2_08734 [Verticillium dahliae VDG2]
MRSFVASALLVSSSVAAASASLAPRWDWPDAMPIEARQEPGTPRFQCHEDCGTTISLSRVEGYCTNAEWRGRYDACMICANTEGIWQFYRNAITPAAAACGLTAEPTEPCETDANGVPTGQGKPTTLVTKTTEVPGHVVVPTTSADAPVQPAPPAQTPGTGSPSHVATAPVVVESADATDGSVVSFNRQGLEFADEFADL